MKMILNILLLTFLILICNSGCLLNDTEKYIEDLHSENIMVKNNAIYYMGKYKEERAVPMLIRLLGDNQQKETRLCSINALGKIGDDRSVEALVEILRNTNKEIRIAAVEALGKIKNSKATKPLLNILADEDIRR